jgi:hypothetical protein
MLPYISNQHLNLNNRFKFILHNTNTKMLRDISSGVLFALYIAFSSYRYIPGIILTIGLALLLRLKSIYNTFVLQKPVLIDVVDSFVSHVVFFAGVYILTESDYTSFEPSGSAIDSLYYSIDTITTNGAARVVPTTDPTKIIHMLNLIDTYVLLTTIGFFVVRNLKMTVSV